jgi:D-alanine-D-alanine ligase
VHVEQVGVVLDPSSPVRRSFSETVALVYNAKPEVSPLTTVADQPALAPADDLASSSSAAADPASIARTDDIYAEWDTMDTVRAVERALDERFEVTLVEANEDAFERLRNLRPAFVFNIAEGLFGSSREAQIPAMLDMLQIPYLGSDPLTLGICLDKARAKEILAHHRIPTAPFTMVSSMEEFDDLRVKFPSIVKPLHEGSSKGIYDSSVVKSVEELEREVRKVLDTYGEPALVEEFLTGREFTVALMGNDADVAVLPIVEIAFDALPRGANPLYSYEAKWIWDTVERPLEIYSCPARIDAALRSEIELVCRRAYSVLRCRDWSRIDVRCDARGKAHIIEVNPLPGILPRPEDNSCFPKAARVAGMTYEQLINRAADIGMRRCGVTIPMRRRTGTV